MLRPPQRGSVDFLRLYQGTKERLDFDGKLVGVDPAGHGVTLDPAFEGVEVGIRYVGQAAAETFRMRQSANKLEERKRLAGMMKGMSPEQVKQFDGASTPEGERALSELIRDVFKEIVAEVRSPGESLTSEDAVEYCTSLPPMERILLMGACLGGQGVNRRQLFRAPDLGVDQAGRAPGPGEG